MLHEQVMSYDPAVLWQPGNKCPRNPWVYVEYRTPAGGRGRLVYDSSNDTLWFSLSSGNGMSLPYFAQHMTALLPPGTVCVIHDKHRRWNTADFTVGVDECLRWRH